MHRQMNEHEVETFTGRYVDVSDPKPENIVLEDVAHALANICRYGGHPRRFYSVAEHAVFVSHRVERKGGNRRQLLAALHHDDAEAFLGDIPRPLKPLLGQAYRDLTERMDTAIIEALALPIEDGDALKDPLIKDADNWSLFVEARALLPSEGKHWIMQPQESRVIVPDYWHGGLVPADAEFLFLERHALLTGGPLPHG